MSKKFRDNRNFKKYKRDKRNKGNKFYQSKEFTELQKEWYDKLSDIGFKDIEQFNPKILHSQDSGFLKGRSPVSEAKLLTQNPYQFYRILSIFSHSQPFFDLFPPEYLNFNTFIVQNYANGASYRDLERLVKIEVLDKLDKNGKHPKYPRYLKTKSPIYYRMQKIITAAIDWYNNNPDML